MSCMDHRIELGDAGQGAASGKERTCASARARQAASERLGRWLLTALAVALMAAVPASALAQGEPEPPAPAEGGDEGYYEDTDPSAVTEFRDTLAPHGEWVDDPVYGTVWVPSVVVVGQDFRPYYTAGRWAVADDGSWVWVSDYDWGYVPFHYGRWVWISGRGWAWIPGRRYAPAWVVWRVGEPGWDYVGWAPMGPSFIWVDGFAVAYWHVGVLPFWFVGSPWLFHHHWHHHVVPPHHHHSVAAHTHVHGHSGRVPASPTSGSADRHGASPTSGPRPTSSAASPSRYSVDSAVPKSPSFEAARIPANARPKERVNVDPRATALAKPTPQKPATARGSRAPSAGRAPGQASRSSGGPDRARAPGARSSSSRGSSGSAWSPSRSAARPGAGYPQRGGPDGWQGSGQRRTSPARAWSPPRSNRSYASPPRSGGSSSWQPPSRSGSSSYKGAPPRSSGSSSWGRSPSGSGSRPSFSSPSHSSRGSGAAPSSVKRSSSSKKGSTGGKSRGSSRSRRR